jgi:putative ABC transport system ATP-binding protein
VICTLGQRDAFPGSILGACDLRQNRTFSAPAHQGRHHQSKKRHTKQPGSQRRADLRRLRLDKIGFIFQAHNLLPFLNATDNVALVLEFAGKTRAEAQARAQALLDYLEVGARALPALLSGGEAQRVAIARVLANSPRIILADEPTAALDSKRAGIVMDLTRKLAAEQDACIIAVTHDEKILGRLDRLFHLRDGRLEDEKGEMK